MKDLVLMIVCGALLVLVAFLWLKLSSTRRPSLSPEASRQGKSEENREAARLSEEVRRAAEILERIEEGLLVLDDGLRLSTANSAARRMLGFKGESLPMRLPSEEILAVARRSLLDGDTQDLVNIWFPSPTHVKVRSDPLPNGGGVLVLLQDVTQEILTQRMRREFVAHASHELKSPVTALQALAEAVRRALDDDRETAAEFSDQLVREADRLGRLVRDLLDLSKLEEAAEPPTEATNLAEVARRELGPIEVSAHSKRIRLRSAIADEVWVSGDDQQLGLMVRNLLDNAVRYTPNEGEVSLEVYGEGDNAYVRVGDSGIGIPLEAHGRVFERFYRVDRARSRDRGGTGLGLAIVKHVAELHGGAVSLQSELGEGSTFTVSLPVLQSKETPMEPVAG